MAGKVIAVAVFATFVALVLWGLSYDVRQWFERRHALRLLAELAEKERRADLLADGMAVQLEEIRNLPEFHGELA